MIPKYSRAINLTLALYNFQILIRSLIAQPIKLNQQNTFLIWLPVTWASWVNNYGSTGCRVFKRGVQNLKDFCLRINILKGNYWILRIGLMERCQKLDIILQSKVISKLMLSKNVNNKNVLLNWYSSMKKIEKDSDNFWHWKSNFGTFWHLPINPILKIQ